MIEASNNYLPEIDTFRKFQNSRSKHWDQIAFSNETSKRWGGYYHERLCQIYQQNIQPSLKVLEIGCGQGDLLASVNPSFGVGIDFSKEMIYQAKSKHKNLHFFLSDAHEISSDANFDVIILSDLLNDIWDAQTVFKNVYELSNHKTRVIINIYSHLWEFPRNIAKNLRIATPLLIQNWLTVNDMKGLLYISNFDLIKHWEEIIWPFRTPLIHNILNKYLVKFWPFKYGALTNFFLARPIGIDQEIITKHSVSIVIPARNEEGNIAEIINEVPNFGGSTELIFVEGHSTDNTFEEIKKTIELNPERNCKLIKQSGVGKGDAVKLGFEHATGDILMIYDADLTVPPESLRRFYEVLVKRKAEFANGVRLVYPMENQSMRFLNLIGNKIFSLLFSWLLGLPIKDTLCGTKVLWRSDYKNILMVQKYFGDFDPFGDFELIFGAAKLGLKIVDIPIRYRNRTYGETNINRWSHGFLLLRMVFIAMKRLKFV